MRSKPDGEMTDDDNPMARAQRQAKPALPKRFFKLAAVEAGEAGHTLVLDGRPARTPARSPLTVPTAALGAALAEEWNALGDLIDPQHLPLTRLVNAALDRVVGAMDEVRGEIVGYAGHDLLCYRAGEPEELARRQRDLWDPVVDWAGGELGGRFRLAEGVVSVEQPAVTITAFDDALRSLPPLHLTGLHVLTTLTGSAILAFAVLKTRLTADEAWSLAHVDEDWQIEQWGEDEAAAARRREQRREFDAAVQLVVEA